MKRAPPTSGAANLRTMFPKVAAGVDEITGHAGREPAKVDTRMTVSRSDILIENHGSIILLRAASPVGEVWVEEDVDRDGYQPFPAGTRIVEPRYLQPIIDGAVDAGLVVAGASR